MTDLPSAAKALLADVVDDVPGIEGAFVHKRHVEALRLALSQPPALPGREEIARVIEPGAWSVYDRLPEPGSRSATTMYKIDASLAKADAILALHPARAEEWRAIDATAKAATMVDLWMAAGYRVPDAHWGQVDEPEDGEPDSAWFDEHGDMIEGEDIRATHYRLPSPPPKPEVEGS